MTPAGAPSTHAARIAAEGEGPGRRAGIERAEMVARAIALVEAEGAEALTMRRLATELDVTTTTIYWHVGGRDELVFEILREQSTRIADRPIVGTTAKDRVHSAAENIWHAAIEHDAFTRLAHQTGAVALLNHHLEAALAAELEAAGLSGPRAAVALHSILAGIAGLLLLALRNASAIPEDRRHEGLFTVSEVDLLPSTRSALCEPVDLPAVFETTMRSLIDGHLRQRD